MKKSIHHALSTLEGGGERENTSYAHEDETENTKYAHEDETENTKYASPDESDNTKYATPEEKENTSYAHEEDGSKDASSRLKSPSRIKALSQRRLVEAAVEEVLMSVTSAVDRVHPGLPSEARAQLVGTLLSKFGNGLMKVHVDAIVAHDDHAG